MLYKAMLIACLTACVHLPHVDPAARTTEQADQTVVRVDVTCSEPSPWKTGEPGDPHEFDPDIVWYPASYGTGVIISERHVLTAAHVVRCPIIPDVTVTLKDGRRFPMVVEKDDAMFGDGTDVARLEIATAENFDIGVAPPKICLPQGTEPLAIDTFHGSTTGFYRGDNLIGTGTRKGDSGSPAYTYDGCLVGLVTAGGTTMDGSRITQIVTLGPKWLSGT